MTNVSFNAFVTVSIVALLLPTGRAFLPTNRKAGNRNQADLPLFLSTAAPSSVHGSAPILKSTLKKPSKVLTVGMEYAGDDNLSEPELSILSMQLRKSKVSAIWCKDSSHAAEFLKEQATAQGNFPGPCPVIYHGKPQEGISASAVVLSASDDLALVAEGMEVVWKICSVEEVQTVLEKTNGQAEAFWAENNDKAQSADIIQALPKGALCIAAVESMQPDGAEVEEAKGLKKLGFGSILVKDACVGDSEDLEYANFAVGGMTSKASSEFSFSGLTGSTNGHFGGVQARGSVKWQRAQ